MALQEHLIQNADDINKQIEDIMNNEDEYKIDSGSSRRIDQENPRGASLRVCRPVERDEPQDPGWLQLILEMMDKEAN